MSDKRPVSPLNYLFTPLQRHAEDQRGFGGQGARLHPVVLYLALCLRRRLHQGLEAGARCLRLQPPLHRRGCRRLQGNNSDSAYIWLGGQLMN